jgi:BirA family biotin operon repressor/biotin-[acetyl-CoA-carboxylase] ligase
MDTLRGYHREGWDISYRPSVGSTNDLALNAGRQGAPEGLVVVAEEQTAGRGRLGRRWLAPPETCLLMSLLFRPPEPFARYAARTTMLCGLALSMAIGEVAAVPATLKWPNDLIVEGEGPWRKVAGMLSEIGLEGEAPSCVVVGIGLNVNVAPADLPHLAPNATSLLAESGHPVDRVALLDAFLQHVERFYAQLRRGWDPLPLWREHLAWLGCAVEVHTPTEVVTGVAEDVDGEGALQLRLPDGSRRSLPVGDISLRV